MRPPSFIDPIQRLPGASLLEGLPPYGTIGVFLDGHGRIRVYGHANSGFPRIAHPLLSDAHCVHRSGPKQKPNDNANERIRKERQMDNNNDRLFIDLTDINIEEVEV